MIDETLPLQTRLASWALPASLWLACPLPACNATGAVAAEPDRLDAATATDPSPDAGSGDRISFGGGEGPHFAEVSEDYEAILSATRSFAEFFCVCEVGANSGSEYEGCVDGYLEVIPPPVLYCSKEVYSQSAEAALALHCQREIVDTYITCITQSTCLDFDNITGCETDRILSDLECQDVPYEVWAKEQGSCHGIDLGEPFECANGELVHASWVCDLEFDCEDGSDEMGCDPHAGLE